MVNDPVFWLVSGFVFGVVFGVCLITLIYSFVRNSRKSELKHIENITRMRKILLDYALRQQTQKQANDLEIKNAFNQE